MEEEQSYILGTDEGELRRLEFQHRVWSPETFELWQRAGIRPGHAVLDVGCGPGYASVDLAQLVGESGKVVAVDASRRFVAHLLQRARLLGLDNVEAQVSDVQALELPEATFDLAYARWVLCFVARPEEVVRRVARALKPGGAFAIHDYFNQQSETVAPRSPAIDRVFEAIGESWRTEGGDPDIGGRLPRILAEQGLRLREVRPSLRLGAPGSLEWQWIETVVLPYLPKMVELGVVSPTERDAFLVDWERRAADPHAFFCSPPVLGFIAVKE